MRALQEGSSKGGSDLLRRVLGEETRHSQANLGFYPVFTDG